MKYLYAVIFAVAILTGCDQKKEAPAAANEAETKRVLDHHWQAFLANDLDETMKDYDEESVLITPNGNFQGLDQIRANFVNAFSRFPKDSTTFDLKSSVVVKDVGYIIWTSQTPAFNLTFGTDTFIIRDGKILRQTFGGVVE